jgi:hypothetical protein
MITWLLLANELPSVLLGLLADGILFPSLLRLDFDQGAGRIFIG